MSFRRLTHIELGVPESTKNCDFVAQYISRFHQIQITPWNLFIPSSTSKRVSGAAFRAFPWGYANMIDCSPISPCVKNVSHLSGCARRQMTSWISGVPPRAPSGTCCFCFSAEHLKLKYSQISVLKTNKCLSIIGIQAVNVSCFLPSISKTRNNLYPSIVRSIIGSRFRLKTCLGKSLGSEHTTLRHIVPKQGMIPKITYNAGSSSWLQRCVPGLIFGFLVSYSTSESVHAEALQAKQNKDQNCDSSSVSHSHGKQVYTDYTIIGIPGDGRCMFRSVAHGACVLSGKPAPNERIQRELADELRASVANEFVKRRKETEWSGKKWK